MNTAARLGRVLDQIGWDQVRLAHEIGATQGAISKIMAGKTANSRLMPRIAAKTGASLPYLLGEVDEPGTELTADEREWVDLYRALEPDDRKALHKLAQSLANSARRPALNEPVRGFRGSHV